MPRAAAVEVLSLEGRRESSTPLREIGRVAAERGLDSRDRGLLRRIVGTEIRRRGSLRAIVKVFARGRPSPALCRHLHVGLVQAFFLDRVPDHALVSESVAAVHAALGPGRARYTNGVLRNAMRARREGHCGDPTRDIPGRDLHSHVPIFRDPRKHSLLWAEDALSMPAPLMKAWTRRYGTEEATALALLALEEPRLSVRTVGAVSREAIESELAELSPEPSSHPRCLLFQPGATDAVLRSAAFTEGRATIQGSSALRAAELMGAIEGERLLDLCAAPGGKTAVLAEAGAHVLACDVTDEKLERVRETARRLGLEERISTARVDADGAPPDAGPFDGVLIDAPCSNTGVLAQRPEARWRFSPGTRKSLARIQESLLERGARLVAPGGRLVWSTCSLEPDENHQRVRCFLEQGTGFELEEEHEWCPSTEAGGASDGGYAARLRRRG